MAQCVKGLLYTHKVQISSTERNGVAGIVNPISLNRWKKPDTRGSLNSQSNQNGQPVCNEVTLFPKPTNNTKIGKNIDLWLLYVHAKTVAKNTCAHMHTSFLYAKYEKSSSVLSHKKE